MTKRPWMPCRLCGQMIWGAAICVDHEVVARGRRGSIADRAWAPYLAPPFRAGIDPYGKRRTINAYGAGSTVSGGLPSLGKRYS